jgi:neutral amino acid transport system ATP-binding protein
VSSAEFALVIDRVTHTFGGIRAVDECSFEVEDGSATAVIGPNGAGKSTLLNIVAGTLRRQSGRILLDNADISGWPPHRIARRGVIRTFQVSRELGGLTTLENMLVVVPDQKGEKLFNALLRPRVGQQEVRRNIERAHSLLSEFGIYEVRDEYARNLSGGQKRLLELARAVMAMPRLLLLDEPMASINPALVERIVELLKGLKAQGKTILMVEHNLGAVEDVCDHVVVMAEGRTLARGLISQLRENAEVVRAYLGGELVGHTGR